MQKGLVTVHQTETKKFKILSSTSLCDIWSILILLWSEKNSHPNFQTATWHSGHHFCSAITLKKNCLSVIKTTTSFVHVLLVTLNLFQRVWRWLKSYTTWGLNGEVGLNTQKVNLFSGSSTIFYSPSPSQIKWYIQL